ncbi:hypothetical protein SARC_03244 [Sphaeroforma arctica JP610]|uniref:Uncharacterized protein n=1 Tax=Sphaeroforma arctica JP610 TaxID=667725 RepID=A0A0L0G6N3_9EUKA|nr:hypothetical protein SARC_03244 [Sphaeroforma arctica JP610]KNC84541.1 hypothetical protein SARC_03244 [Sphaeroforma arctica JP610]|eukprot:XP_014158443.1 hypothetical protein SARC_03244 [Sphaeroforma arctica JP610]
MRAIERIQNPRDCRSVGYDIHVGHYAGLGSQLHVAGRRMLGANTHGRVFILNHETDTLLGAGFTASQTFCEESGVHGFECYFQTLSNCTEYGSSAEAESVEISGRKLTGNRDRLAPLKDHTDFQGITSNTKESVRLQRAYATEYMLRPNTRFQHKLELMYSQVFDAGVVPPKLISVNIRWGDKWSEMLLNPIERYVGTVADLVRLHYNKDEAVIVFLQTWEQDAHDHFHRLSPKAWDVRSFAFDRSLNPHDTEGARSPNSTTISLCSMYIAADAMFHVGTRDSNWDRLIDELRITRGFHRPSSLMVDLSESGGDMRDNP